MSDMPISDPSPSYSFPPRHSSSASSSQSSSLPQRRVSRPSPSASVDPASSSRPQHEIQPPSRRLSSHQMLLLTPFGSNVPDGIFVPGESSSFMTRNVPISAEMSVGSSSNMTRMRTKSVGRSQDPRTSTFPPPSGMRRGSSRMGSPSSSNMQVANPSSLVSAPMSTIPSASESETEIEAAHGHHVESGASVYPVFIGDHLSTVPMTRSTSSPVMSLQALEELKRKDGELGIARGGMWAWISHDMDEVDSPRGESSTMIQSSNPRDVTPSPTTSASLPLFRDPFAPPLPLGASVMTREIPTSASSSTTTFSQLDGKGRVATASNYHYSPNQSDGRRMSEAPVPASSSPRSKVLKALRRPSVPLNTVIQSARRISLLGMRSSGQTVTADNVEPDDIASVEQTDAGPSVPFPKLSRYRSLPSRRLNMAFSLRSNEAGSGGSSQAPGRSEDQVSPRAGFRRRAGRTSGGAGGIGGGGVGAWASVDIIDSLTAPSSPPVSLPRSITPDSSILDAGSASDHTTLGGRSHRSDSPASRSEKLGLPPVGAPFRRRFESVDSAFASSSNGGGPTSALAPRPSEGGGVSGLQVTIGPFTGPDWRGDTLFPRRGSLMLLTNQQMIPWTSVEREGGINVEIGQATWSSRRGSWVEGWELGGGA